MTLDQRPSREKASPEGAARSANVSPEENEKPFRGAGQGGAGGAALGLPWPQEQVNDQPRGRGRGGPLPALRTPAPGPQLHKDNSSPSETHCLLPTPKPFGCLSFARASSPAGPYSCLKRDREIHSLYEKLSWYKPTHVSFLKSTHLAGLQIVADNPALPEAARCPPWLSWGVESVRAWTGPVTQRCCPCRGLQGLLGDGSVRRPLGFPETPSRTPSTQCCGVSVPPELCDHHGHRSPGRCPHGAAWAARLTPAER